MSSPNNDSATLPTGGVTDHDDIRIDDHPIPSVWKWMFISTILFALPYFAYYHFGAEGRTLADLHGAAVATNARLQFAEIGELSGDEQTLVKFLSEPSWLRVGQSVYKANCVSCHGPKGGGIVGPNLTDEAFKNVTSITDIYSIVNNGAAAGAMPAWKTKLQQNERVLVASYVASLRGTDPGASSKGPEGKAIPPWPAYIPQAKESATVKEQ
jgi:cytochrome c oxidase cbb3-type subunit III